MYIGVVNGHQVMATIITQRQMTANAASARFVCLFVRSNGGMSIIHAIYKALAGLFASEVPIEFVTCTRNIGILL